MTENELAKIIVDKAYHIHKQLGPGLLESVYENILAHELKKANLQIARQVPIQLRYDDIVFEDAFRADIIVENKVLIELKSIDTISSVHFKQTLTYIKLMNLKLGLLINFNEAYILNGIRRVVNGLREEIS